MITIEMSQVPVFYQGYVKQVQQYTLPEALTKSWNAMDQALQGLTEEIGSYAYADGKWTIKELLLHVNDAERIFCYRALCFSRNDQTPLPGFDEQLYTPESNAGSRTIQSIAQEMKNIRVSTIDLFESFTPEMLSRSGTANNTEISVNVLGYVIAGHQLHHLSILRSRYFPK